MIETTLMMFNQDITDQAGHWQVTSNLKERNTEEHRKLQADGGQQGFETPPHKPGPNQAKRGARAGTESGRAQVSPTT